ncbi:Gp37Gp68 family protein [Geobacter metallireducens RCH3]|uniref:Uncharacterized protein n=1 Tax=Geobacter metallireducens (strain ATCC 53774 / DSM 7210 / GS-15) TaxID=269799 RepID=Q39XI9_GEOMG|nr:DUF5131 family protein [Geobacter metallireducens]ABB31035.1 hypothetical protein Gmet_0793 [Geobacter metallireducens GS-15]EHP86041.1 Gp37Gp68 family protein [Geobacter metallireducens RCH3]
MFNRLRQGIFWDDAWEVLVRRDTVDREILWRPFGEKEGKVWSVGGDPFHPSLPVEQLDAMLSVVASSPQHLFITVTDYPEHSFQRLYATSPDSPYRLLEEDDTLNNLWFLVRIRDQEEADLRVPATIALKNCWVADGVRWPMVGILAEPLRGGLNLRQVNSLCLAGFGAIDWVVCGGAGDGDVPHHADWARDLRDQAEERGIPFLYTGSGGLLDGRTWDEIPPFRGEPNHLHVFDHCRANRQDGSIRSVAA